MYLILYKRKNKLYFNYAQKLTDRFTVTNEKFETVKLGYKDKIKSYKFNSWDDFKLIRDELKQYGLRMYIAEVKLTDKTQIKLVIELMNNPLYVIVLVENEAQNDDIIDGETGIRVVELFDKSDWDYAQEQFCFESDFFTNLW